MAQNDAGTPNTLASVRNEFARKLQAALSANGWSQNDLVERSKPIAESEKAALQAYDVSNYIRGRSLPRPEKLATIARIFKTTPEALLPSRGVAPNRSSSPMEMRQGEDGNVWLRLERMVSYTTALAIMKLLADEDGAPVVVQPSTGEGQGADVEIRQDGPRSVTLIETKTPTRHG